ncbi:hypothetical protein [Lacipirellula sp.]|uniref:hypothetical protein n=1 Tax=Lacipirellula sp. TaxID=2691419 RepID=UPI003D12EE56
MAIRRMLLSRKLLAATLLGVLAGSPGVAWGRVKLITLPVRERVEIQLDNEQATLVEEERIVPLVKGENQIDFSWANTQIDPGTIVFRVVSDKGDDAPEVKVLSVSYPPNESALVWSVSASEAGAARVRISYLLGNLTKSFNYRAVASNDERTLDLSQFMRLKNLANEEFAGANLWAGFGPNFSQPVGLNETKELLVERFKAVPIEKTYTCNPQEYEYLDRAQNKLRVPMHYVIKNDAEHGLGKAALPFGKVRIFIAGGGDDPQAGTAFLGEDWGKFTPRDDEMRLYLGVAQDVVVKRTIEKNETRRVSGNLYDQELIVKFEVENFKKQPVRLDVIENLRHLRNEVRGDNARDVQWELGKETTFADGPDEERSNAEQLVFHAELPAAGEDGKAEKQVLKLHITLKNEW